MDRGPAWSWSGTEAPFDSLFLGPSMRTWPPLFAPFYWAGFRMWRWATVRIVTSSSALLGCSGMV